MVLFYKHWCSSSGGSGDASSGVHLSVQAAGEAPGSAGGGEEAAGSLQQRERRAVQTARRTGEAAEACRYSSGNTVPVSSVQWSLTEVFFNVLSDSCMFYESRPFYCTCIVKKSNGVVFIGLTDNFLFLSSVKAPLSSGGLFQGKRWFRGPNSKLTFAVLNVTFKSTIVSRQNFSNPAKDWVKAFFTHFFHFKTQKCKKNVKLGVESTRLFYCHMPNE